MKEIKIIAFDADDTLWSNEPFFQDIERAQRDICRVVSHRNGQSGTLRLRCERIYAIDDRNRIAHQ